jgi:hypothetical protein
MLSPSCDNLQGVDFAWFRLPSHEKSGGILVGVNSTTLQVKNLVTGDYCVKLHVRSKHDGLKWAFVQVYGAAKDAHKAEILFELVRMCQTEALPTMV